MMAFRLIFESSNGQVTLTHKARINMTVPDSPTDLEVVGPGTYAEVRNQRDETIYRTNISSQIDPTHEVFNSDASVRRVPAAGKKVAVVILPDQADAQSVVVVQRQSDQPFDRERRATNATVETSEAELLRVPLADESD